MLVRKATLSENFQGGGRENVPSSVLGCSILGAVQRVLCKEKIFPGRYLALPCERDRVDWQKIKISPAKETSLGVAQTLFGPYKETNRQPNKQWFKQH